MDRGEGDAGESIESDEVAIDFVGRRDAYMSHPARENTYEQSEQNSKTKENVRVIRYFIPCNIPVCDQGIVGVIERRKIGHFGLAAIGIFALSEELVDGIEGVGLHGIVSCEHYELRDL